MNRKKIYIISIILVVIIFGCIFIFRDNKEDINSVGAIDSSVDLDNGEEKVDWDSLDSSMIKLDNKSLSITKSGVYTISGSITNGSIIVDTDGDVKLILDNVNITNTDGPAIIVENANNVIIEIGDGSTNTIEDGDSYSNTEYDGCLFSRDDLILQGNGTLKVISNYADGIVSNDDLKIVSGTYIINSQDDGIRGKDSVYIVDGEFTINSGADGIKSTNDMDDTKGYVNIDNGIFNIESGEDGIQAETKLIINNGVFNIKTSDGSGSSASAIDKYFYGGTSYDDTSSKGFKSVDNLVIKNGTIEINSKDDAIHSNNYVGISNVVIKISSGDDGIHADEDIIIDGGNIDISKSYEGIEGSNITINNGEINIIASDDGINISGGNDSSSVNGRPGQNYMSSSSGTLTINNGTIYVDATGDGLDANGNIVMNGGNVYVDGPTNGGNGALDYDTSFDINGGEFIAVGSSGMALNASDSSRQYSVMFNLSDIYFGKVSLVDETGNIVFEYIPKKKFQSIVLSNNKLEKGKNYTLIIDNEEIDTISVNSITNMSGYSSGMGMPGSNGEKPGGGRNPRG